MNHWRLPRIRLDALHVWRRNVLVWRKLMGAALVMNFGEPFLYLMGLGFGLGFFIQHMEGMSYLTFLASGIISASAMHTASFEAMYSVFTRMVPQQSYEAMMTTPLELDDILFGEMLWCASKALLSGAGILLVASLLGAVEGWQALAVIPVVFLAGLAFSGPALVMSALAPSYDFFAYYQTLVMTPMFILCGVFYPSNTLPAVVHGVVQLLPLTHVVALVRPLVAGLPLDDPALHVAVLVLYALGGFYLALALTRRRLWI
ncbi:ABC transporter permease [Endothiovibrio diazotrophicus]